MQLESVANSKVTTYDVGPAGPVPQARIGLGVPWVKKKDEGLMATLEVVLNHKNLLS